MKENEKKYNAIDFTRYHSGAMPTDEMHALEKAALEDPFLADALDGYAWSKDPETELDEIRMRLNEKRKQKNVFSIFSLSHNTWWKIAAMVVVIAGAGYFFFINDSQKESLLAVKKDMLKKENPAIVSPVTIDTNASEGNIAFEKTSTEKNKKNPTKLPSPTAKSIQIPPIKRAIQEENKIAKEKNISEEDLVDKQEKNMAMNKDKMRAANSTLTDSGEKSFFRSSDTNALAVVSPKGYFKDSLNAVALNREESSLQEVVVTGYGKKNNNKKVTSRELQGKVSGIQTITATPYLREGKEKFDQYIKDNTIPVLDSAGKKIPVNILLSFTLNKKGKPTHIKVLGSSCKTCEEEAIRLLKSGPDWVGKSGAAATVRIQF